MGFDRSDDLEDDLDRSVQELGEPEALFRVGRGRFIAKLFVGIALVLVGIVANYLWWVEGPGWQAAHNHFILVLLLGTPITGCCLLWHMYHQRGLVVLLYPTGLLRLCRGEVVSFPWDDVDSVRVMVQRAASAEIVRAADGTVLVCWLPAEAPAFRIWKGGLYLTRRDGVDARIGVALSGYRQLAEEVQKRIFALQWPPIWERFQSGASLVFGDLELSSRGIWFNGKLTRWKDVKDISILQGVLHIKTVGKWSSLKCGDVFAIPNPHILFALVREAQLVAKHS